MIVTVLSYYLFQKKRLVRGFEISLHSKNFPYDENTAYFPDCVEYMAGVLHNPQTTKDQAIVAAAFVGQVETLKIVEISTAWKIMSAMDVALDNYFHRIATKSGKKTEAAEGEEEMGVRS